MNLSVIICTRNRAESLRQTLESIGKVTVPQGWSAELLVVDNGSSDHTHAVANEIQLRNMNLRHVSEPMTGLSNARNAGLREASGEIILFTDDDVRFPWNWVEGMCRPILNGAADAIAGGVVFPAEYIVALSRPAFSSRRSWFASTEELDPNRPARMVGANMAFHRRVLARIPKFDVELGAGALGFGEETLFSFQLLSAGYKLIGVFDVFVEHHFDLARLSMEGVLDQARKRGRSHAFIFHHWEHQRSRLVIPRLVLCQLRRVWTRCFAGRRSETADSISDQALQLEQDLAFYREYIVQRRRGFKYSLHGLAPQVPDVEA